MNPSCQDNRSLSSVEDVKALFTFISPLLKDEDAEGVTTQTGMLCFVEIAPFCRWPYRRRGDPAETNHFRRFPIPPSEIIVALRALGDLEAFLESSQSPPSIPKAPVVGCAGNALAKPFAPREARSPFGCKFGWLGWAPQYKTPWGEALLWHRVTP